MSRRFYSNCQSEIDMRQELISTFEGNFPEVAKKMSAVLRKMRRGTLEVYTTGTLPDGPWIEWNALGKRYRWREDIGYDLLPCPCKDKVTREPDKDHFCPICFNEGWLWDETFIEVYKVTNKSDEGNALTESLRTPGIVLNPLTTFYLKYSVDITKDDKIVELYMDNSGNLIQPYRRKELYTISMATDLRCDNAKLEYWKLNCYSEYRKFLNGPGDY